MSGDDWKSSRIDKPSVSSGSIRSVYKDLLMQQIGSRNLAGSKEKSADNESFDTGYMNDGMLQSAENSESPYNAFKRTILNDDSIDDLETDDADWLDESEIENTLDDYITEADESFIKEDDSGDSSYEEDEYLYDYYEELPKQTWSLKKLLAGLTVAFVLILAMRNMGSSDVSAPGYDGSRSVQKQISHLYHEMNKKEEHYKSELDNTVKIVISQFEKNIKKLIPSNIMHLQSQLELLNTKVNSLAKSVTQWGSSSDQRLDNFEQNVTQLKEKLVKELQHSLPDEIPVIYNNASSILVIPELHSYISQVMTSLLNNVEFNHTSPQLDYDLNSYIKEILENNFHYVDKEFFINELNKRLQLNNNDLWHDINVRLNQLEDKNFQSTSELNPEMITSLALKKTVYKLYNANQHQWEDDLDYATFGQGSRLLNHLTSSTWKNGYGTTPLELLSNSYTNSVYWQCAALKGCTWSIRFHQPLHLFKIFYMHGRMTNNIHIMNSAPKKISIYVKLVNDKNTIKSLKEIAASYKQGQTFEKDSSFIKIGQYTYNLADTKVKQQFLLPSWFIKMRPLVHSIAFQVNENYGNKKFTSLRKFIIKAVTQQDLQISDSNEFPLVLGDIPDYSASSLLDEFENTHLKLKTKQKLDKSKAYEQINVPSFGQDDLDV